MARESFVGACQLITLAIVISNPGTALAGGFKILNETTDIGKIIEPLKNNKGCINFSQKEV